jgi:hypothetical protein
VGFHADPSDVEIAIEFLHLPHDIVLLVSALFKKHSLAQHKHTHIISLLNAYIGQPHGIIEVNGEIDFC